MQRFPKHLAPEEIAHNEKDKVREANDPTIGDKLNTAKIAKERSFENSNAQTNLSGNEIYTQSKINLGTGNLDARSDSTVTRGLSRSRALEYHASDLRDLSEVERIVTSKDPRINLNHINDENDIDDQPKEEAHKQKKDWRFSTKPLTKIARFFIKLQDSFWVIKYFIYISPIAIILLIPILVLSTTQRGQYTGGVERMWIAIWIEIVWLSFWAARISVKILPILSSLVLSIFVQNNMRYRYILIGLEIHIALFLWAMKNAIAFRSICLAHNNANLGYLVGWQNLTYKILMAIFIGTIINLIEKSIIQLIATSFHDKQYADRIAETKFAIKHLANMYIYSRTHMSQFDEILDYEIQDKLDRKYGREYYQNYSDHNYFQKASYQTEKAFLSGAANVMRGARAFQTVIDKFKNVLTDREYDCPIQNGRTVVDYLLGTTNGAQILARQIFKSFAKPDNDVITLDDIKVLYQDYISETTEEEIITIFSILDQDSNGDISLEELENRLVEMGKNRKIISKSLRDLDTAVSKLDYVLSFMVFVIFILILLTVIYAKFTGILASASTFILGISWVMQSTAQEFLGSCIFVFSKHPFDVGDRVDILFDGAVQSMIVKEINLLNTEFKLLNGRCVQAPNNVLNTLFINNHRRSSSMWDSVIINLRFGTTIDQIEALRLKQIEFVKTKPRDFKPNCFVEVINILSLEQVSLSVIFGHKSNWQNETLRRMRHNMFICSLMQTVADLNLEPSMNI